MTTYRKTIESFLRGFVGSPASETSKVIRWNIRAGLSCVLDKTISQNRNRVQLWLPAPGDRHKIPVGAIEYPAEAGRNSNTYAAAGLEKGKAVIKCAIEAEDQLAGMIAYIVALAKPRFESAAPRLARRRMSMPARSRRRSFRIVPVRETIPRSVQREVWRRDDGRCVECGARGQLCFDHIVPFSLGGSTTARNIQLLCERCNAKKGNRI